VLKQWTDIELTPGQVLFLPRGYWHTTENIDASLHEFRERCDALSTFSTPEKVTALLQAFQDANSNNARASVD
jgi:hypothetical protein